jgi:sarcosine oxidase subunit alpha
MMRLQGLFRADNLPDGMIVAGAANGVMTLASCLQSGLNAGQQAVHDLGLKPATITLPRAADESFAIQPFWHVKGSDKKAFVDFQNDVGVKDIKQSHREGFRSVEHLKRYTTLGMATDQGKIANIPGLAILADISAKPSPKPEQQFFAHPIRQCQLPPLPDAAVARISALPA